MKLSFVIPLFNKEKNILATLKSIISACEENNINDSYEIIVVDDGSTDSSGKIVREFIQLKNSCVRYYFQNNSGPSMARNRGVSESTGEYILFVDADDLLLPAYIAYILYCTTHYHSYPVYCAGYSKVNSSVDIKEKKIKFDCSQITIVTDFFKKWKDTKFFYTSSICVKRSFWIQKNVYFPVEHFTGEDQYAWFCLAEHCHFVYLPQQVVLYKQGVVGQLSSSRPVTIEIHVQKLLELEKNISLKKDVSKLIDKEFCYVISNNFVAYQRFLGMKILQNRLRVLLNFHCVLKLIFSFIAPRSYNYLRNRRDINT